MVREDIVYTSAVASLVAQVVLGSFTSIGLFVGVPEKARSDLTPIYVLELASQLVEFLWYLSVVCIYKEITTWTRYLDWFFSTPVMLISTVLFFLHRTDTDYSVFLSSGRIYMIIMFNWLMLSFGFALETDSIPQSLGLAGGGTLLVATFSVMATFLEDDDVVSVALYSIMFFVWGLYGVAAAFPYRWKNVAYNVLDIISKNFYGVFLAVYSFTL